MPCLAHKNVWLLYLKKPNIFPNLWVPTILLWWAPVLGFFSYIIFFLTFYSFSSSNGYFCTQMCRIAVSQLFGGQDNPPRMDGIGNTTVEAEDPRTATTVAAATASEPRTRQTHKVRVIVIPSISSRTVR